MYRTDKEDALNNSVGRGLFIFHTVGPSSTASEHLVATLWNTSSRYHQTLAITPSAREVLTVP